MGGNRFSRLVLLVVLVGGVILLARDGRPEGTPTRGVIDFQAIIQPASAAPQIVPLFSDDFESGTGAWNLDSNWSLVEDGLNNMVLEGSGHAWATLISGEHWSDYTFDVDVKMLDGAVHVMYRVNNQRGRYILGMHPGGLYLRRESPWGDISSDLAVASLPLSYNTWYHISIDANVKWMTVRVDGVQRIFFTDSLAPTVWQGTIGLETVGSPTAQARFDNVHMEGVPAPDVAWVKTGGPMGGLGYDVRYGANLETLYVTDNYSGVSKSLDGGKTWFATNRGITGRFGTSLDAVPVFSLTVDPNNPDIVWAGLKDVKGIYKSTNAGQSWEEITTVPISETQFVFRGFTIQPGNSNIVYAQGELPMNELGKVFDKVKGRIYRTGDGGQTWEKIWEDDNLVRYVIIHPDDPDTLYASLGIFDREAYNSACGAQPEPVQGTGGVIKLHKEGSGWDVWYLDNGLTDPYVGTLFMHPEDPNIMLAGAGNTACSRYWIGDVQYNTGGVFLTRDSGNTWVKTLSNDLITAVEFSPNNPNIAYAGGQNKIYKSEDGGETWTTISGASYAWGPPGVQAGFPIDFLVNPGTPGTIFANNYGGGNVVSDDGGETWKIASQGYTGALMLDVALNPQNPRTVYGAARSGLYRSENGGQSWYGLSYAPASLSTAYAVAVKPDEPSVVLTSQELLGHLYRSTDGGDSWQDVFQLEGIVPGQDADQHGLRRIVFAPPPNANVVYAASCRGSVALDRLITASKGIYKSTNGGVNWSEANDTKTTDKCFTDIAIHPTNPGIVYAASPAAGIYKSEDFGNSWSLLSGLPVDMRSVGIRPDNAAILYAGTKNGGMYKSENGGTSWSPHNAGMEPNDTITAIIFDPLAPEVVWAASDATGVYRWVPDEGRWTHVNDGLRTRSIQRIVNSPSGELLYAATTGEGVFRMGDLPPLKIFLPLVQR